MDDDPLDAARGIILGLILSIIVFWAPLIFIITKLVT